MHEALGKVPIGTLSLQEGDYSMQAHCPDREMECFNF